MGAYTKQKKVNKWLADFLTRECMQISKFREIT